MNQRTTARINLSAIERNCQRLQAALGDEASLCAVVKADGYGHGIVPVAQAALAGGASWLAVAAVSELEELRAAGIAGRILVMGAMNDAELERAVVADGDVAVWRESTVRRLGALTPPGSQTGVHVKLDTGMGRLGTRDPVEARRVALTAAELPTVKLVGLMTHFATADDLSDEFFDLQLERFSEFVSGVKPVAHTLYVHAANSAALLRESGARFDLARCGIAIYGLDPYNTDPREQELEPALELCSYVAEVKPCAAGESAGYGRKFIAATDTEIATVPIGYGDGYQRALSGKSEVLVNGQRFPLAGTVSMDNITVDLGLNSGVKPGDQVVLIGSQGEELITAEELALLAGTINYEIATGITRRVPRNYHHDGIPAQP